MEVAQQEFDDGEKVWGHYNVDKYKGPFGIIHGTQILTGRWSGCKSKKRP